MNTVHVAMGEMGVIMEKNPIPRYLATLGACPCVIYAVWLDHPVAGKISILAHVHRGSKVADLRARIEQLMHYNSGYTAIRVYIVTELFQDTMQQRESAVQLKLIERLEAMTAAVFKTVAEKNLNHSVAALDHQTGELGLFGDNNAPFALEWAQHVFRATNVQREMDFDRTLRIGDDYTPMRVNIGLNQWDVDNLD